MIRIQNMDAYWKDIRRIANSLSESAEVDEKYRSVLIATIANHMIYLDVQRALYRISDKEMEDAIRKELYRQMKKMNLQKPELENIDVQKAFAAAHECCGGCV